MSGDDQDGCGNLKQRDPALDVKCLIPILATPLGAKHRALRFTEEDAEIRSCPKCNARWDVNSDEPAAKPMLRGQERMTWFPGCMPPTRTASTLLRTGWAGVRLTSEPRWAGRKQRVGLDPKPSVISPSRIRTEKTVSALWP